MKKIILWILCLLLLATLCLPAFAEEADPRTLADITTGQISSDIRALFADPINYSESSIAVLRKLDLSNLRIIIDHPGVPLKQYRKSPQEQATEHSEKDYYILDPKSGIICKATLSNTNKITLVEIQEKKWPNIPPSILDVLTHPDSTVSIHQWDREVLSVYCFSSSYVSRSSCLVPSPTIFAYGIVYFETTDGIFVRLYTGSNTIDMTLEYYRKWVDAYFDYQTFYNAPEYYQYAHRQVDQFDELVSEFGNVDAYYDYVQPYREAHQKEVTKTALETAAIVIPVLLVIAFIIWRRIVNQKKYKM